MDVTAKYELIGLMAYPIRHSLSPEMQNKALEKAGLPFTYMAFEVDNDSFPGAIEGLKDPQNSAELVYRCRTNNWRVNMLMN